MAFGSDVHPLIARLDKCVEALVTSTELVNSNGEQARVADIISSGVSLSQLSPKVLDLILSLQDIFRKGIKPALGDIFLAKTEAPTFWPFVAEFTIKDNIEHIQSLARENQAFATDREKQVAWIIIALNEASIPQYFQSIRQNPSIVGSFYNSADTLFVKKDHLDQLVSIGDQIANIYFDIQPLDYAATLLHNEPAAAVPSADLAIPANSDDQAASAGNIPSMSNLASTSNLASASNLASTSCLSDASDLAGIGGCNSSGKGSIDMKSIPSRHSLSNHSKSTTSTNNSGIFDITPRADDSVKNDGAVKGSPSSSVEYAKSLDKHSSLAMSTKSSASTLKDTIEPCPSVTHKSSSDQFDIFNSGNIFDRKSMASLKSASDIDSGNNSHAANGSNLSEASKMSTSSKGSRASRRQKSSTKGSVLPNNSRSSLGSINNIMSGSVSSSDRVNTPASLNRLARNSGLPSTETFLQRRLSSLSISTSNALSTFKEKKPSGVDEADDSPKLTSIQNNHDGRHSPTTMASNFEEGGYYIEEIMTESSQSTLTTDSGTETTVTTISSIRSPSSAPDMSDYTNSIDSKSMPSLADESLLATEAASNPLLTNDNSTKSQEGLINAEKFLNEQIPLYNNNSNPSFHAKTTASRLFSDASLTMTSSEQSMQLQDDASHKGGEQEASLGQLALPAHDNPSTSSLTRDFPEDIGESTTAFKSVPRAMSILGGVLLSRAYSAIGALAANVSAVVTKSSEAVDAGEATPEPESASISSDFEAVDRATESEQHYRTADASSHLGQLEMRICPDAGLDAQSFKCHGCKKLIGIGSLPKAKLCDVSGRYFCDECHGNKMCLSPARIIHNWHFDLVPAARVSIQAVAVISGTSLVDLEQINPMLFEHVESLQKVKILRAKLCALVQYASTCSTDIKSSMYGRLWPREHLAETTNLYKVEDLVDINSGMMETLLLEILSEFSQHVTSECEVCHLKGSYCQICSSNEIVYAFEADEKIFQCPSCLSTFHRACHEEVVSGDAKCFKCGDIQSLIRGGLPHDTKQ